jgi:hypothetical protein
MLNVKSYETRVDFLFKMHSSSSSFGICCNKKCLAVRAVRPNLTLFLVELCHLVLCNYDKMCLPNDDFKLCSIVCPTFLFIQCLFHRYLIYILLDWVYQYCRVYLRCFLLSNFILLRIRNYKKIHKKWISTDMITISHPLSL